ncbi:MAG: mechanosensitive ion channel family protein [Crocinitomicaceae bacterium]|jgi:small-conductance mechanosensitive channel|nr:mechanosensitive ion channel family protein [Crocinitomicaceae bacterium]MDP4866779.1 mechanosensitive ion channel family protein [Crocinitomicaceae bacterium]MDP5011583.1 mechanosensitive ion channel family protein [Crocinitomicaceae bacterium]
MEKYTIQLIESGIVVIVYILLYFITKTLINNALKNTHLQRARRKMVVKAIQLIITLFAVIFLAGIWGLDQSELAIFASSIFTALGIAFFAKWSLLSNITSSIILFFNHPLKIGDKVRVLDKDCPFEGEISDLTYFFVHLTTDDGEVITVPNSLFLEKSITIIATTEKN